VDGTSNQCAGRIAAVGPSANNSTETQAAVFWPCYFSEKFVHRNAWRKSRWEEKVEQSNAMMFRRCQRLVKQNSGRVLTVDKKETGSSGKCWYMKWSPWTSAVRMETINQLIHSVCSATGLWTAPVDICLVSLEKYSVLIYAIQIILIISDITNSY